MTRSRWAIPEVTREQAVPLTDRGWIVVQGPLRNQHVIPNEQQGTVAEHEPSTGCWCEPRRADPDLPDLMGRDVYIHRRTHDHGHRYSDREG